MQLITVPHGETMLSTPDAALALKVLAGITGAELSAPTIVQSAIPAIGQYWPFEGGINGGPVPARGDVPAHYLIFATDDAGEHEWGSHGKESGATSRWDGLANTKILLEGGHPAAREAAEYSADGHSDFFLGSPTDMHQAWVYGLITKGAYWTSTQFSAYYAYYVDFSAGSQGSGNKYHERSVRPVRRRFI